MTAGPSTTSSSQTRTGLASQTRSHGDAETISASQVAGSSSAAAQEARIAYPPSMVSSLKPAMGAFIPQIDHLKKGLRYIADAAVEYEEVYGSPTSKTAGSKDRAAAAAQHKKPAPKSKAAQAAYAEMMAFSEDPVIHGLEDTLATIIDMQRRMEVEQQALSKLASLISMGGRLPGEDLLSSFEKLMESEAKHQEERRKQDQKARPTPGGADTELIEMRKKIWQVHHDMKSLPRSDATPREDGDDDDMEIIMTDTGVHNLKCPITTNFLEDPVTSSECNHSFSKEAILQLIQSRGANRSNKSNNPNKCLCPVHGCNRPISADVLQPNKALARKVARQMVLQEEATRREDDEYTTVI
ncbi:MAG: zinc-finger of the MIZ type in Nse subunit-domain-containing protein [Benniella sp.]|nr:MAG: zinc-finger of the MIZ type in Nse subunit-domain-containing protein [Benniella sp.]